MATTLPPSLLPSHPPFQFPAPLAGGILPLGVSGSNWAAELCVQPYIAPKTIKPCICISLSLLFSLAHSFSLFLSHSPSYSPGRRRRTSGCARLQLSRGALRWALYRPQDYATMRLCISPPLSPSLPPSRPLSYSSDRRHLTSWSEL